MNKFKQNVYRLVKDLLDSIKTNFCFLFKDLPNNIKYFFINLKTYFNFLIHNRDWDYGYVLEVLLLKIRKTREHVEEHKAHTNWKRDVRDMKKVELLIEQIIENDFGRDLYKAHDNKWGPPKYTSIPIPDKPHMSRMVTLRVNAYTPEEQKQENKEYRIILKKVHKLEQQAWNSLWTNLNKNLRNWWC